MISVHADMGLEHAVARTAVSADGDFRVLKKDWEFWSSMEMAWQDETVALLRKLSMNLGQLSLVKLLPPLAVSKGVGNCCSEVVNEPVDVSSDAADLSSICAADGPDVSVDIDNGLP